jgi:hypothetical protein
LIFSGAADDLQQIMDDKAEPADAWIGLYPPRIS